MTGFASLTRDDGAAAIGVTIRAVNHRFLDLQLRIPPTLAAIEPRIRSLVQARVARGRVEVSVSVQQRVAPSLTVELNEPFLDALAAALDQARARGLVAGALTPGDLLRFPQALAIREATLQEADPAAVAAALGVKVEAAVEAALEELDAMRTTEGGYLRTDLDARRRQLAELYEGVSQAAADGLEAMQARLAERVRELRAETLADEAVVAQEIAKFAGRSDITEEVVRFRGHLDHWQALSDGPEPCGRKLDFLLQEMNREVNTTASKAEGTGVSELIVALKAELEKLREQVQNVE
ncbi:MAG TPA: YicC/YloC family endoribonuclease [Vicinamibacterales bacterium]|nr:YicC/YloC family endoribonuclease [Vicinamibacterales bacterium]